MSTNPNMNDGGPAFPAHDLVEGICNQSMHGMSLRDWFAGKALEAMHSNVADIFVQSLVPPTMQSQQETKDYYAKRIQELATTCYNIADAMLNKRDADMNL